MDKNKTFVSLSEAAEYTGYPYNTLYRWATSKPPRIGSAHKRNNTAWVISVEDMERIERGELR